jgi:glutamyl-tRNA(Gln) amidotransferase subunit E
MDYKKLGLRVGLEIHQQLASNTKLFCRCPVASASHNEYPVKVTRRLRPVAGELGKTDPAAIYEFFRNRSFVYNMHPDTSCLVEADEDPPQKMNKNALITAIQTCKLLCCKIVDEVHVMRKTVIDGSSVSGFQRTSLIGLNGNMKTSYGNVGIQTVCIEEDASPPIKKDGNTIHYRQDRLGIPLIEIATDSTISSPEQAREVAEYIGLMLRSMPVVRGIGSIRQDVNISVKEGARVEIKGFQELEKMSDLIKNEAERQSCLIEIKNELHKRGMKEIKTEPQDVTPLFKNTKNNFLRKIVNQNGKIFGFVLPCFAELLKKQCGDRSFGKELSAYAEAYGYGIIHSDEDLIKYELKYDFDSLKKKLKAEERDVVVVCAGESPQKAAQAVIDRATFCLAGVPEETRVSDGIGSKYTRPLPGSERMYPESDVPAVALNKKFVESIKKPRTLLEKSKDLERILPKEIVSQLIHSKYFELYEEFSSKYKIDPKIVATTLLATITELKRDGFSIEKIKKNNIDDVFAAVETNKISKKSIRDILQKITEGNTTEQAISQYELMPEKELKSIIKYVIRQNPGANESVIMGIVMQHAKGRADGETVIKILRKMK